MLLVETGNQSSDLSSPPLLTHLLPQRDRCSGGDLEHLLHHLRLDEVFCPEVPLEVALASEASSAALAHHVGRFDEALGSSRSAVFGADTVDISILRSSSSLNGRHRDVRRNDVVFQLLLAIDG